jgi:hypothetical protein
MAHTARPGALLTSRYGVLVQGVSRAEELTERLRARNIDQAKLEVEEQRAGHATSALCLVAAVFAVATADMLVAYRAPPQSLVSIW